ncbi:MAG: hypothetical protein KDA84_29970, partial [Planctomycetaceae bacterium]|nr:hypothetical protein [Planctomycetaceae bacterium]
MHQFFKVSTQRLGKALISFRLQVFSLGLSIGAMVLAWCFQWTAWFGTSLPVVSALVLAFLLGVELAWRPLAGDKSRKAQDGASLLCQMFLVIWSIGFPWFVEWQSQFVGAFSPTQMAVPALALAVLFLLALVIVTPPVYALSRMPSFLLGGSSGNDQSKSQTVSVSWFVVGIAFGVL